MSTSALDPSPRKYPPAISLIRRSARRPALPPRTGGYAGIESWLLDEALAEPDLLHLFETLVWRLVDAGLGLDRASLHIGTLHPQLIGFAWNWNRADGLCDEVKVAAASLQTDSYRRNPLAAVIERGERVFGDARDVRMRERYPLLAELAASGITEYLAEPLTTGGAYHNAVTLATRRPDGFDAGGRQAIDRILKLVGLHVERHIAQRVARNILNTYLGGAVGDAVLAGSIKRGSGEAIRAIIWSSDLRGFTDLSERLSGSDITALLDAYFECLVQAITGRGGEVLKFIGDGLLAVFRFADETGARKAAHEALEAAEQALASVNALNDRPPDRLAQVRGWQPLRTGIALHLGDVYFGNIGAPERLDFTVIGRAVNEASRVEGLTKELKRPILITSNVAALLDRKLDDLGAHMLRGREEPMPVFAPPKRD